MLLENQLDSRQLAQAIVYEPKTPLQFDDNGRLLIYENREHKRTEDFVLGTLNFAALLPSYLLLRAAQRRSLGWFIFWSPFAVYGLMVSKNSLLVSNHMIHTIHLRECGTQVVLTSNLGYKRVINIVDMQKVDDAEEVMKELMRANQDGDLLVPLFANDEHFLINIKGQIFVDTQVFKHILNGYCIETSIKYREITKQNQGGSQAPVLNI